MGRVLVVDDIEEMATTLAAVVGRIGYEAAYVIDPRQALVRAAQFQPAVVLLDIGMPRISGYELAPKLRKALEPRAVRIVAVTAWGSARDREYSKLAGFDAHLVKPVAEAELRATLEKMAGPPAAES